MSYLVDSGWLIGAQVGLPAAVRTLDRLSAAGVAVSVVSYGEIFEGAHGARNPEEQLERCRRFLSRFPVVPLSDPIMATFARIRADLRRQRRRIPDFDLAIAATAIHHDLTLLTRNRRHFGRIEGLSLYQAGR